MKITITAVRKAIKNHYGLKELKEVQKTEKSITYAKGSSCLITFEIFGNKDQFFSFNINGYANYILCEWLLDVMKVVENA